MPVRRLLLILLLACLPALTQTDTYVNARFHYSVEYPRGLLVPQGESANGDGQRFESKDKRFRLIVWGQHNALDRTLTEQCRQAIEQESKDHSFSRTYQVIKPNWFVFSGVASGAIIYQKTFLQDGVFKTLRLEYAAPAKNEFDAAVKRIVGSFRSFPE